MRAILQRQREREEGEGRSRERARRRGVGERMRSEKRERKIEKKEKKKERARASKTVRERETGSRHWGVKRPGEPKYTDLRICGQKYTHWQALLFVASARPEASAISYTKELEVFAKTFLGGDFLGGDEPFWPNGVQSLSSVGTHPRRCLALSCSSALSIVDCSKSIQSNQPFRKTRDQQRTLSLLSDPLAISFALQHDRKTQEQKQESPCEL